VGCGNGELKPRPLATDAAIRVLSVAQSSTLGNAAARIALDRIASRKMIFDGRIASTRNLSSAFSSDKYTLSETVHKCITKSKFYDKMPRL
jgi:hypothetical protein